MVLLGGGLLFQGITPMHLSSSPGGMIGQPSAPSPQPAPKGPTLAEAHTYALRAQEKWFATGMVDKLGAPMAAGAVAALMVLRGELPEEAANIGYEMAKPAIKPT